MLDYDKFDLKSILLLRNKTVSIFSLINLEVSFKKCASIYTFLHGKPFIIVNVSVCILSNIHSGICREIDAKISVNFFKA